MRRFLRSVRDSLLLTALVASTVAGFGVGQDDVGIQRHFVLQSRCKLKEVRISLDGSPHDYTNSRLEWSTRQTVNFHDQVLGDCKVPIAVRRVIGGGTQLDFMSNGSIVALLATQPFEFRDHRDHVGTLLRTAALDFNYDPSSGSYPARDIVPGYRKTSDEMVTGKPSVYRRLCDPNWASTCRYEGDLAGVLATTRSGDRLDPEVMAHFLSPMGDLRFRRHGPLGTRRGLPLVTVGAVSRPSLLGTISGNVEVERVETTTQNRAVELSARIATRAELPDLYLEFLSAFDLNGVRDWSAARSRQYVESCTCESEWNGTGRVLFDPERSIVKEMSSRLEGLVTVRLKGRVAGREQVVVDATIVYEVVSTLERGAGRSSIDGYLEVVEIEQPLHLWCPR